MRELLVNRFRRDEREQVDRREMKGEKIEKVTEVQSPRED